MNEISNSKESVQSTSIRQFTITAIPSSSKFGPKWYVTVGGGRTGNHKMVDTIPSALDYIGHTHVIHGYDSNIMLVSHDRSKYYFDLYDDSAVIQMILLHDS